MRGSLLFVLFLFLCGSYASAQNIFRTACRGDLVRLDSLLTEKSINVRDGRGRSLLHWAIGCDKPEVFEYLIENGIDINLADQNDKTPLFVAVLMNQVAQFDSLVKLQADTSWIAEHGITLLERAILNKSEIFVRKLIAEGVPVNASNERGSTPLEIAKRIKAEEIYELLLSMGADASKIRKISMAGPYMGETIPGLNRRLFAPNFISTEESEFGSIFNAAGTEFFYGVVVNGKNEIRFTRKEEHQWTVPEIILSHPSYGYNDPFLSPAEDRLYSISNRALDGKGEPKDIDIWYVERTDLGWSEPVNAGPKINTSGDEYYISFTADGTMYFSSDGHAEEEEDQADHDIYYSKWINGEHQKPVRLGPEVNSDGYEADVFVSPDESYLIFCSTREGGLGQGDLYISFKKSDSTWTVALNMGDTVNSKYYEYCPFVSHDGKYLFFTSNQDIYWVSTEIIAGLKEKSR